MKEKLKQEYHRLIKLYRRTRSKVVKEDIVGALEGVYDTCVEYGVSVPKISNYIIGYTGSKSIWYESNKESLNFVKTLGNKIFEKYLKPNYEALNILNQKVNGNKYGKIVVDYLKNQKKELYDLYIKMEKEKRFFEINTGQDSTDCDFFVISYLHEDKNIAVIDCYTTLSCYLGIIHELSHVDYIERHKFFGKPAEFDIFNNLSEVYPIYSELLLGEYLKNIKATKKNYAYELYKNQLIYPDNDVIQDYDHHFMGDVLALNFFDMYLKDKEKTEYNFEQFLRNYEANDFKTNINSYGLSEEKILSLKAIER